MIFHGVIKVILNKECIKIWMCKVFISADIKDGFDRHVLC